jgi:hypothetical protein
MNVLTRAIINHDLSPAFSFSDLKYLGFNKDRLYPLIEQAVNAKEILKVKNNIYLLNKKYRSRSFSQCELSQKLVKNSYVSLEFALSDDGWIPEAVYAITCVTMGKSKKIFTSAGNYFYENIPQKDFCAGVYQLNSDGFSYKKAKPLKALADIIYTRGYDWTTLKPLNASLRIEDDEIETLTSADFDEIQGNYDVINVENFLKGIRKELQL